MAFTQKDAGKVKAVAAQSKGAQAKSTATQKQSKQKLTSAPRTASSSQQSKSTKKDDTVMRKVVITVVCVILALAMTIPSVAVMLARNSNDQAASGAASSSSSATTFESINQNFKNIIAYAESISSATSSSASDSGSAASASTSGSGSATSASTSGSASAAATSASGSASTSGSASAAATSAYGSASASGSASAAKSASGSTSAAAASTSGSASASASQSASAASSTASATSTSTSSSSSSSSSSQTESRDSMIAFYHYYWAYELAQFVAGDGTTSGATSVDDINTNFQAVADSIKSYQDSATDSDVYEEYIGTVYYEWIQALKSYSSETGEDTSAKVKLLDVSCIEYLEKALDIKYTRATAGDLATAYYWNGDTDKAIETALKVTDGVTSLDDLSSDDEKTAVLNAWVNLGIYYSAEGETDKAKDAYSQVSKLDPDDTYNLASTVNQYLADLS